MRTGKGVIVVLNWQYRIAEAKEGRMGTFSVEWLLGNNSMQGLEEGLLAGTVSGEEY